MIKRTVAPLIFTLLSLVAAEFCTSGEKFALVALTDLGSLLESRRRQSFPTIECHSVSQKAG